MKKSSMWSVLLLTLFLVLSNLTCTAQQSSNIKPDSLKGFTPTEVREMAKTILQLQECSHLLDITNKQLRVKMELLADDDAQLVLLKKQIADNEIIITNKNQEIKELNKLLKKEVRRKKFWKFATCATAVVSTIIIVVVGIR